MNRRIFSVIFLIVNCILTTRGQQFPIHATSRSQAREGAVRIGASPVLNGLVAYYPLDGNANDSSGNGFNGTVINATPTTDRFGHSNSAYNFNGYSSTIQCGDILDSVFCAPVAQFTLIGWAKTRTWGSFTTGGGIILDKSAGGTGPYQWGMSHQDGLVTAFVSSDGTSQNHLDLAYPVPEDVWFQFALVFDGSQSQEMQRLKLYVNGDTSKTFVYSHGGTLGTSTINTTQYVCIGASHELGHPEQLHSFYDGTIDDFRIYNRPLSQQEIDSLYYEGGYFVVTSFTPSQNAVNVSQDSSISIGFSTNVNTNSFNDGSVCVNGTVSGRHLCNFTYNADSTVVTISPKRRFEVSEVVSVTLTRKATSKTGDSLSRSFGWSYTTKTNPRQGHSFFSTSIPLGIGSNPHSVAAMDVDGNGAPDLAVANYDSNTVTILRNDGNGNFSRILTEGVGNGPNDIIAADLDGDGFPDLVTTNNRESSITILKNDRQGGFINSNVTVGYHPVSVAAADLNGDGAIDLAVANNYSNSIFILKNNGQGMFTLAWTVSVGMYPASVAAADLNNDGFVDLVVTNSQSNSVSILLNNGDGTFTVTSTAYVGSVPWNVVATDLNGDGFPDLAVTNNGSGSVTVLLNDKSAHFFAGSTLALGGNPSSLAAVDLDGDGALDLGVANILSNTVSFWHNDGYGRFTGDSLVQVESYPCSTIAADLDGNGKIELVTANGVGNSLSIISGPPPFAYVIASPSAVSFGPVDSGTTKSKYLKIFNAGTDSSLYISDIISSSSVFAVNKTSLTIPPSGTDSIVVFFSPTKSGLIYTDSLILTSNDNVHAHGRILLTGSTGGLVAYFPFNGNAHDSCGNEDNGAVYNASLTTDRFDNSNSAYNFDGYSSAIRTPAIDLLDTLRSGTVSLWMYTTNAAIKQTFLAYTNNALDDSHVQFMMNASKVYSSIRLPPVGNPDGYLTSTMLQTAQWYHIVYVADGTSQWKIYVNGKMETVTLAKYEPTSDGSEWFSNIYNVGLYHHFISIGVLDRGWSQDYFSGKLDDIRIYDKPLSQTEVRELYHEHGWDTANHAPVALAGPDRTFFTDTASSVQVGLDASASYDVDGDSLLYEWREAGTILGDSVKVSVSLPLGKHNITLTVSDGKGATSIDTVVISIDKAPHDLVAYYPFTSNAIDSSGHGFDGIVYGAALTTDRFVRPNCAYSFNGTSSTIQCGDILDDVFSAPVARFTIVGWAYTRTWGSFTTGGGNIVVKSAGGTGPYQFAISHQEGLVTGFVSSDGTSQNHLDLAYPVPKNVWFQFALVFDGSQSDEMRRLKLYINGDTSETFVYSHGGTLGTSTINTTQYLCFGASHELGHPEQLHTFYDGNIDDIRIYSRPLPQQEIDSLYQEGGWPLVGVKDAMNAIPQNYSLEQNYPNPFNPSTTMRYGLPAASHVTLEVYDILGQIVAVLVDTQQSAGWKEIVWNAKVASGLYFYRLEAVSVDDPTTRFVSVRKMLFLK